jgi:hypothetical protein
VCHYAKLTFPVPAVIVVTLLAPTVAVVPVSPAPIVMVNELGYFKSTMPEPPAPEKKLLLRLVKAFAPPPPPVFAVPLVAVPL